MALLLLLLLMLMMLLLLLLLLMMLMLVGRVARMTVGQDVVSGLSLFGERRRPLGLRRPLASLMRWVMLLLLVLLCSTRMSLTERRHQRRPDAFEIMILLLLRRLNPAHAVRGTLDRRSIGAVPLCSSSADRHRSRCYRCLLASMLVRPNRGL